MRVTIIFIVACLLSCSNPKKQTLSTKTKINEVIQLDSASLDSQLKNFETTYNAIVKEIGDSVSKYKEDWGDFSELTKPLEKKYKDCKDDLEKTLLGYKLANNYMLCYKNSDKTEYKEKAEPLFYSFLSFKDGELASRYMKLGLKKVQFMQKEWKNFSEADKETLLIYGLLRGFKYGLPDVLKNVKE